MYAPPTSVVSPLPQVTQALLLPGVKLTLL
jgi:hypothetical protein